MQRQRPPIGGVKRISHLGAGVAAMCHGHSRRPFSSRALTKAATRPIARSCPSVVRGLSPTRSASNGCARRFSPSAPPRIKGQEKFLTKGGPNSSRNKIASLRRPPLTLRPFASLRVQAARAGLLSAAPRDTSWRWASGPRRKTRRIFDNGHEPLQVRPQARNPHPRHLRDRRPALPPPGRRGKRRPGLRPHRPRIRSHPRPALDRRQAHGRGLRRLPQRQGDRHALPAHRRGPRLLRSRGRPLLLRKGHVRPATPPPAPPTAATTNSGPRSASKAGRSAPASSQPTWRCRPSPSSPQPTAPSTPTGTSPAKTGKPTRPPPTPRSRRRPPPPRWEPSAANAPRGGGPKGPRPPSLPGALRRPTVGAIR